MYKINLDIELEKRSNRIGEFKEYYSSLYKTEDIPYYLWNSELVYYAAKHFRKDPLETDINKNRLHAALEKYINEENFKESVFKTPISKYFVESSITESKKPSVVVTLPKLKKQNSAKPVKAVLVEDIEMELFED